MRHYYCLDHVYQEFFFPCAERENDFLRDIKIAFAWFFRSWFCHQELINE